MLDQYGGCGVGLGLGLVVSAVVFQQGALIGAAELIRRKLEQQRGALIMFCMHNCFLPATASKTQITELYHVNLFKLTQS